jgi:PilZ domain
MAHSRRHSRREIRFPLAINSPTKSGRVGVARNLSCGGVLLGTPSRFAPGQRVRLHFKTTGDGPLYDIVGTVVRTAHDPAGGWLSKLVAIAFDRTVNEQRVREIETTYALFA